MSDSINSNDETDRLVVAWPTSDDSAADEGTQAGDGIRIPTPEDIVVLRRTDPAAADDWRQRLRTELQPALRQGGRVTDFTREGEYVVVMP